MLNRTVVLWAFLAISCTLIRYNYACASVSVNGTVVYTDQLNVTDGDSVKFECSCSEDNNGTMCRFDGIGDNPFDLLVRLGNDSVVLACVCANSTELLTLRVDEAPINSVTLGSDPPLNGAAVAMGTTLVLSCTVDTRGENPVQYTWMTNGRVLQGEVMPTLTLSHVSAAQAGGYNCSANNTRYRVDSNTIDLQIYSLLEVTINSSSRAELYGVPVTLACQARLSPNAPPTAEVVFSWTPPWEADPSGVASGTTPTSSAPDDGQGNGTVVCTAQLGSVSRQTTASVVRYNVIFDKPGADDVTTAMPFPVSQSCAVRVDGPGVPNVTYFWRRGQAMVSTTAQLNDSVNTLGVTVYTCVATVTTDNGEFAVPANYTVTVEGAPTAAVNVSVSLVGLSAVRLTWQPPESTSGLAVNYTVNVSCSPTSNFSFSTETQTTTVLVLGVQPQHDCSASVAAASVRGVGPATTLNFTTAAPSNTKVENLSFLPVDPITVNVSWTTPPGLENVSLTYNVSYRLSGVTNTWRQSTTMVVTLQLRPLLPATNYTVQVVTTTDAFPSDPAQITGQTLGLRPGDLPPEPISLVNSVRVENDNQSFTVSWEPAANTSAIAGQLLSVYRVSYRPLEPARRRRREVTDIDVPRNDTSVTLTALEFFTAYNYSVDTVYGLQGQEVTTVPGPGGNFTTGEGEPGMPTGVQRTGRGPTWILVAWDNSTKPNGVITRYSVQVTGTDLDLRSPPDGRTQNVTSLRPSTRYTVRVCVYNSQGSTCTPLSTITEIVFVLGQVQPESAEVVDKQSVSVTIPAATTYGGDMVSKLFVFVSVGGHDLSEIERATARERNYLESPDLYVTATYTIQGEFTAPVGDGTIKQFSGKSYTNIPLTVGQTYRIFVRYYSHLEPDRAFNTELSSSFLVKRSDDLVVVIVVVIIILIILIVAVVILIIVLLCCFRRQPNLYVNNNYSHGNNLVQLPSLRRTKHPYLTIEEPLVLAASGMPALLYVEVMTDDAAVHWALEGVELKGDRYQVLSGGSLYIADATTADSGKYSVIATNGHGAKEGHITLQVAVATPPELDHKHPPIKVEDLMEAVALLRKDDGEGFSLEFQSLDLEWELTSQHARAPCNAGKNRFINISPYDHSRVILNSKSSEPGGDYINASFLDGYNKPKAFIASQGPTASSIDDFWRMVWQYQSPTIVMVTRLEEGRERLVVKCNQYWPEAVSTPRLYGDIKVTMEEEEKLALYCVRKFTVQEYGKEGTAREIRQFHFLAWPDHGVPEYATAILSFRQRVRQHHDNHCDGGPMVVHCSAGVGRTGTFIAIDTNIDRMEEEGRVDVFNFVRGLRWRRNYMVQTEPQYAFIYDALAEYHNCGDTSIVAANLKKQLYTLDEPSQSGTTVYQEQFKKLASVCPSEDSFDFVMATMPDNVDKNRSQTRLPPDTDLVPLGEGSAQPGYINATHLDGYRQLKAFITTQTPLEATQSDFWRMIWEQQCHAIVSLGELVDNAKECNDQYWPSEEGKAKQYGALSVELLSQDAVNTDYLARRIKLWKENKMEDTRTLTLFHYTNWPQGGCPGNASSLIELVNDLQRVQRKSGNHPITVQCLDGVGSSGALCALMTALERVKTEQIVDVFRAVKSLRIQRSGIVESAEQYKFIHEAILQYLTGFEGYSNFA